MIRIMRLTPDQAVGRTLGVSPELHELYDPPIAGKALEIINLPAYFGSGWIQTRLEWTKTPAFQFTIEDRDRHVPMLYTVGVREITFAFGICVFWAWIGRIIERGRKPPFEGLGPHSRSLRLIEMIIVTTLAIVLLHGCARCIPSSLCPPPQRQVALVGLVWPVVLLVYLAFLGRKELRAYGTSANR